MRIKGFQDTIAWYDQNSEKYSQAVEKRSNMNQINEFVNLLKGRATILDTGCAGGRDSKLFYDKGLTVVGIDISKGLLKLAKNKYPYIKFVLGDFRTLPFPEDYFDCIWAHASLVYLETIRDVKKSLREFHRVLKNRGVLYILVKAKIGKTKITIVKDSLSKHERFFRYF